jgi:hypothetical protein
MTRLAAVALATSGVLSALAILAFSWSIAAARALMPLALIAAALGALASGLALTHAPTAAWAIVFSAAAGGSLLNGRRQLIDRPARWIHRFVIYTGYGMTLAAMGAAALWLAGRAASAWMTLGVFAAAYAIGSACIFLAKTLIVKRAVKTMPDYAATLTSGQGGQDYW